MVKKIFKYFFLLIGCLLLVGIIYASVTFLPIMSGMAAKTMCSCVFVLDRTPESVIEKEFAVFPGMNKAKIEFIDSSAVTAKILWSTSKAVYRPGLGCTLLAERPESEVMNQEFNLIEPDSVNQDSIPWPSGNIKKDTVIAAIEVAIDKAFAETDPEKPKNTLAVIVLYDGQIIGERYASGFDKNSRFMGWSMTKSLTNALLGTLIRENKLSLDQPAPVAEWQNDERKVITIKNLMQGSSGLEWNESYFLPGDFHNMFMHSDDKGGYAASKKAEHKPDEFWEYSSGTSNILSKIIRETVGDSLYHRYPYEKFFRKIGMNHALLEPDASGTFVGSSYGYASARDWARFGLLFLNDGMWNGERILPEGWSKFTSTPAPASPIGQYGGMFWLNAGAKGDPSKSYHPGLPQDEYGAEGFEDEYVWIIPSKKLVIVRLGVSHHGSGTLEFAKSVIEAVGK
ncbi:MAG: serine hydrolase [Cyclobacteriaceae bacterium]|nr:serine hydrolase [Cyclobacteriaceae bacterium]